MNFNKHISVGIAPEIGHWMYDGAYINLLKNIDPKYYKDIKCPVELGARDCYDSIHLAEFFNCTVHAFEANPQAVEFCKEHIAGRNDIVLYPVAVGDHNGKVKFYPVNTEAYRNIGASSLFKFDMDGQIQPPEVMAAGDRIQNEVEVDIVTLESQPVVPDALFMDIQGAELAALKGLGSKIDNVKLIILETQYHSCYKDAPTFYEIDDFLQSNGFRIEYSAITNSNKPPEVPNPPREFWFDLLYVRN